MSYMGHNQFAFAGGIQELSFNEIDAVSGGFPPAGLYVAGKVIGYGLMAAGGTAAGVAFVEGFNYVKKQISKR
ncbi:MAG: hypothetical protein MUF47_00575 [Porphyrobacter sp.]|jgi:hypothetical protein|nr:hypothetical protein [Porphyrobacter sp.]